MRARVAGLLAAGALGLGLLLALPGIAAADLSWSTSARADQTLVNPRTGAQDEGLLACASATACVAFGASSPRNSETVTGDEVTFDPTGLPSATHAEQGSRSVDDPDNHDYLTADACPDRSLCVAVFADGGAATFDPKSVGIVTGTTVIDQSFYAESGTSGLNDVVCPAANECVGLDPTGYEVTFDPHVLHKATTSPIILGPAPIIGAELTSLACPSRTQCTAVGASEGRPASGVEVTFNPRTPLPGRPVTLAGAPLGPVACPSAGQCSAGTSDGSVLTFDPTTGRADGPAVAVDPAGAMADGAGFGGLVCLTTSDCVAVDAATGIFEGDPLAGSAWHPDQIAGTSTPSHLQLGGLACPSPTECVAVGPGGLAATGSLAAGPPGTGSGGTSPGQTGTGPASGHGTRRLPLIQARFTRARNGHAGLLLEISRIPATLGLRTVVVSLPKDVRVARLSVGARTRRVQVRTGDRRLRFTLGRSAHRLTVRLARSLHGARLTVACTASTLAVPQRMIRRRSRARLALALIGAHRQRELVRLAARI